MAADTPTIDSHIHLWSESDLATLNWCKPEHPLASDHELSQYKAATASSPSLKGFIVVEADRKHDLSAGKEGWKLPLQETAYFAAVAGEAKTAAAGSPRCLGIVPWAPVPSGAKALEEYLELCEEAAGEEGWDLVKGVRYLVQDKEHGTMLKKEFVEAVKLLGQKGLVFELGVDVHRRGKRQMDEVLELIGQVHEGVEDEDKTTFVISEFPHPVPSLPPSLPPSLSLCPLSPPLCQGHSVDNINGV